MVEEIDSDHGVLSLGKKCRIKNGLRSKKRTQTGVKRKKNRIRPFPFFKMSGFFPFFVRFLKKLKTDCVLKNGKLPENCRKIAGKLPEKKRKFQKTEMDGSVFQISVFFKFPFFFRFFSGFKKRNPFFLRFSKTQSPSESVSDPLN